jgi:hypothetical protein
MLKKMMLALTGIIVASLLSGCATILKDSTHPITVNSNVDDAEVLVNGTKIGETPFIGRIQRGKNPATLVVRKDGYRSKSVILDSEVEPVFWVNILSGGVLGSTTDYASENMWKYAPQTLNIDLEKK